jgi:hypothetical protein
MGEKTVSFVEKSYDFAVSNPSLLPFFLSLSEFEIGKEDALKLRPLNILTKQLYDGIEDTVMVAGSETYQAALVFYSAVKQATSQDIPGAKAVYEELKVRFPGRKKKKSEE